MNWLTFHRFSGQRAERLNPGGDALRQESTADDESARSSGWFDSSSDLKRGLEVTEIDPTHGWPDTVPLAWTLG